MKVILDANLLVRKGPAHDYLAQTLNFPDYYGRNLDALYDCLTEMSDLQIEIINSSEAYGYYDKVLKVLKDALSDVTIK